MPKDRYVDGIDQTSFLLDDQGQSNRRVILYFLDEKLAGARVDEFQVHDVGSRPDRPDAARPAAAFCGGWRQDLNLPHPAAPDRGGVAAFVGSMSHQPLTNCQESVIDTAAAYYERNRVRESQVRSKVLFVPQASDSHVMVVTMHSDLSALLEAAKDYPKDDTYRFVLADWLEENGRDEAERARGKFIRLQCQRAQLIEDTWDFRTVKAQPKYQELKAHEDSLRRTHLTAWLGVWQPWVKRRDNEEHWFQRGLLRPYVEDLIWLEKIAQAPGAWAWVDGLNALTLGGEDVKQFINSSVLRNLNALSFGPDGMGSEVGSIGPEGARALACSPHLTRLTSLDLSDCLIGTEGAKALAESPNLSRLTVLNLGGWDCTPGNLIKDEGVRALAKSSHLGNLLRLNLMENGITADGMAALAQSQYLNRLTYLELSNNPIGLEGAQALAASPFLTRLKYLGLELRANSPWSRTQVDERELEDAREILKRRFGKAVVLHPPSR